MEHTLRDQTLAFSGRAVLTGLSPEFTSAHDPCAVGVYLAARAARPHSLLRFALGRIGGLARFTSCYREESFWMKPAAGLTEADVRQETQWLLAETTRGDFVMLVPLLSGPFRFSLAGSGEGLALVAETGDPFTPGPGGEGLFVAAGDDPYELLEAGARSVAARLGTTRLRREKEEPDFAEMFGWCTWDAFYREVTAARSEDRAVGFRGGRRGTAAAHTRRRLAVLRPRAHRRGEACLVQPQ